MSSINEHYTFEYSQPGEYNLSHDSVFLARRIFEDLRGQDLSHARALDICAGSGIIGMDFLFHRRSEGESVPVEFDFLEIQSIYESHFKTNVERLGPISTTLQFLVANYEELQQEKFQGLYDLVLCNPPYFLKGHGKLSPSEFKNRCRFFMDSDVPNLFKGIENTLKENGKSYLLLKDLPEHKWNALEEARKAAPSLLIESLGDVRGTNFIRVTKP